ncbi:MAG: type IV secretory system conjugative DNA transfer family protein [Phenylobacterium sp.]|uniref:type IV secretory system conjugative DNA transfer family protein n=1 Tax=Phenylobacterium sp. TaxID=1871053 RepID=UPI001822C45D|nr:type IV secretory system conjugative DNA transfer family protein [Phenylobacterium sp.]MBA4794538.1 type IV secretory system conjugative DNA transfer family protein [Phenylobacterium sp.]
MTPFASATPAAKAWLLSLGAALLAGLWITLWMLITLGGLGQLSSNVDLAVLPRWLWYYRGDPEVVRWLKIGAVGSFLFVAMLALAAALQVRRPLHGAARWAGEGDLRQAGLRARRGLLLGRAGGSYLRFGGAEHVLLYAPTRTGKGVGVVIPNLLDWPGSAVVLDIKRENYDSSAGFRAAHGQAVHLFDPLAADGRTARFNPLAYIDRSSPIEVLDELQKIAGMLFTAPERTDPFWAEASRTGFVGVGAYIAETPELPFTIGEIYRQLTVGNPRTRFPNIIADRAAQNRPLSAGCVNALTDFCAASENTFASVRQTLTSRLNLWLNPLVDAATSESDFDLRRLRDVPTTLYLGASPDNLARVQPLYNLLFQQLVDLNTRHLPRQDREPRQILVLLDEFARLGAAPVIARGFSFVAGYGLRFLAVLQSPSQLRAEYGHDIAEEIISNCGVEVVFAPKELKVAQELSDRLGYYTTGSQSRSRPTMLLAGGRRTTTDSEQRRALMLPQELMQLPPDRLIVLRAGMPPVRGKKLRYFAEGDFTHRVSPAPTPPARPVTVHPAPAPTPPEGAIEPASRPLTEAEAAGEELLTPEMISLALEAVDMDAPPERASEEEVARWAEAYIDRAALDRALEDEFKIDVHREHAHDGRDELVAR